MRYISSALSSFGYLLFSKQIESIGYIPCSELRAKQTYTSMFEGEFGGKVPETVTVTATPWSMSLATDNAFHVTIC